MVFWVKEDMTALPILPHGTTAKPLQSGPLQRPSDGPTTHKLFDLWEEAQKRLWKPKFWWQNLMLRKGFDLTFIKPHEFRLLVPAHQLTDCDNCTEVCCTGPNSRVSLGLLDQARLIDAGLSHAIQQGPHGVNDSANKLWAQSASEESLFFRGFPVLKRDATQTCALLNENLSCGAFPHWPMSCERYPFAVNLENKTVFWAEGCASLHEVHEPEALLRGRQLFHAAIETYNQRIRDVILLYVAMPELADMGLLRHLSLHGTLERRRKKLLAAKTH
ncbi:MAG: hypothetical protein CMH56_10245 [Myxococcales bacterium]|nr:hypothetical protein [Myxococcales bacterium]